MTTLTAAIARTLTLEECERIVRPVLAKWPVGTLGMYHAIAQAAYAFAAERAASAEQDAKRWIDLLSDAGMELARCKVFVGSREKMHPDGLILYQELLDRIDAAIDAARGAP